MNNQIERRITMGFTTAAFIRRNTPELRKKLEELGYKECIGEEGPFLFTSHNIFDCMYTECGLNDLAYNGLIDCGTNEDLFLAIVALRDDIDIHQWFTDGNKWFQCRFLKVGMHYSDKPEILFERWHKATVEELIEHFGGKEE